MTPTINITITSEDHDLAARMAQHIAWSFDPKNAQRIAQVYDKARAGVPAEAGTFFGRRVHIATATGNVSNWLHDARQAYDQRRAETERNVP